MRSCCCRAVFSLFPLISLRSKKKKTKHHTDKHLGVYHMLFRSSSVPGCRSLHRSALCNITGKKEKWRADWSRSSWCVWRSRFSVQLRRVTRGQTLAWTQQRWHCGTHRYRATCGASHRGGVFFGKFASPYQVLWSEGAENDMIVVMTITVRHIYPTWAKPAKATSKLRERCQRHQCYD